MTIKQLAIRTAVRIVARAWGSREDHTACPLAAMCLLRGVDIRHAWDKADAAATALKVSLYWVVGFNLGWDQDHTVSLSIEQPTRFVRGYRAGCRARKLYLR